MKSSLIFGINYCRNANFSVEMSFNFEKRQTNNPVKAMLNRFNKVRVESQTKDLEDQLSLFETGEEPSPSTSASGEKCAVDTC